MTNHEDTRHIRDESDVPPVIEKQGWRYHHLGIPTHEKRPGEQYIAPLKMYVSGFSTSPYGIEWMRFEPDSPVSDLVKRVPHIAFQVDDLEEALKGKKLLSPISSPSPGIRVAMIVDDDAPVELLEIRPRPDNS